MAIEWHNEKRKIKELVPYVSNPRQITEKQAKDLKASLDKFGYADPIVINTDNTIIGGHQRKKILESLIGVDPDFVVDVRVPSRELSIDELRELNVRLNKNTGEFDFDILANNFELDDLLDWGFEEYEFGIYGDLPSLDELETEYGEPNDRDYWLTIKIEAPPEIIHKWEDVKKSLPGSEDWEKFNALISGNELS